MRRIRKRREINKGRRNRRDYKDQKVLKKAKRVKQMNHQYLEFNKNKFEEVLHYVISETSGKPNVGKVVLCKIMYFIDFDYYELNNISITGETYKKLPLGPVPSHFDVAIKGLKDKVKQINAVYGGQQQKKFISIAEPKLKFITGSELEMIKKVIERIGSMSATQASGYSHGDLPWRATEAGKNINYELVFYRESQYAVTPKEQVIKS